MRKHLFTRIFSLVLAAVMVLGLVPGVSAEPAGLRWKKSDVEVSWDKTDRQIPEELHGMSPYKPTDLVRVSIVLEGTSTLKAGYRTMGIGSNPDAMAYDLQLQKIQQEMASTISAQALGGKKLDVVWNLTLAGNIISANIPYGKLDAVKAVAGVADVVLERQYETTEAEKNTYASAGMVGATTVWQTGLTGAGSRVAIIDTGTDTDHQSFDNGAYRYALERNAAQKGMTAEDYIASLDLLDVREIRSVLNHLNAAERVPGDADVFYISEKLPFGVNYVDKSVDITHDHDQQGSHGSHVAGIAAANRYIPRDGAYADARDTVRMSGVAPDAQIITMKVFGKNPGPYDSDYFAAIEDAIWLGCDSVNLSLGSGSPGYSENYLFADLLDYMATTDTVVVMSAGNSGHWAEYTAPGSLYADGVSFQTNGSPGSYTNSLAVASVDNSGIISPYFQVGDTMIAYTETNYTNQPLSSLDTTKNGTEYDYVYIDGFGYYDEYEGIDLNGKVVFCQRGELNFSDKGNIAAGLGAAAIVVCNDNDLESLGMDLSDYRFSAPCVSVLMSDGAAVKAASTRKTVGYNTYYTGKLTVTSQLGLIESGSDGYTMSAFSSWGVPGSLELKPEITAPGGMIWSVNGVNPSADAYELMSGTSMAAPQVTGMAALVAEDIRGDGLLENLENYKIRHLAQSLLMSTAQPLREKASGSYYSVLNQGAGLARVDLATTAESFIRMNAIGDGKVKAELGDDPDRTGVYSFSFEIVNLDGSSLSYALSADVFTQDQFRDAYGNLHLDTKTCPLAAKACFTVNGVSLENMAGFACDLNGDGSTNAADADHLLEYLLGNESKLHADGDVNGDGKVNSYDAHVLLTKQTGSFTVDVPAGGSATVEVTLELTRDAKKFLDENYPVGAYVEAFVFATPVSDAEGVKHVTHSIPVLGYYGSWTDPSMFEIGGYLEYAAETESRIPYLYQINGNQTNLISVITGGKEYVFGGNSLIREAEYRPERNAFNNRSGAVLNRLFYTLIRNAENTRLLLEDARTGEIYQSRELGMAEGAYFHTNMGQWVNPVNYEELGLDLSGFQEGTRLNIRLVAAPEYYCSNVRNEKGDVVRVTDWDSLGEGAYLTTPLTIDNTAPVIQNVVLDEETNTLNVTARDGEYVAAVALLNAAGTNVITASPANQTQRGVQITTALDLSYVFGEKFQVAVYDYAENVSVYELEMELHGDRPYFTAINRSIPNDDGSTNYIGMDTDGITVNLAPTAGRDLARAAEYVEGAVFEITNGNRLYVGYDNELDNMTYLCHLDPNDENQIIGFSDIAYNRADGKLYGLYYSELNSKKTPYLTTIDLYTGKLDVLGEMPIDANCLAIDGEGNFYSGIYGDSQLHTYKSDVVKTGRTTFIGPLVGELGYYGSTTINSMAWDHNTNELYWGCTEPNFNMTALMKVNTSDGTLETVREYDFLFCGLYIAYEPEADLFPPTEEIISVTTVETAVTLVNNTIQLSAQIAPWNATNKALTWSTSDASVAAVDANGLVTGIKAGTAVITATSVQDPGKSASCTVSVNTLQKDMKGIIWDEKETAWWSEFNTGTVPEYTKLASAGGLPVNATMIANGVLYASTLDRSGGRSDLYTVDPETFEMTPAGGAQSIAYLDMAYGPNCGCGFAVYRDYVLFIDLETGDCLGVFGWTEGIASSLVGITYYDSQYIEDMGIYADFFLILDSGGNVYLEAFAVTPNGAGNFYGPTYGYLRNIGDPVDCEYFQGFHFDGEFTYWTRFNEADEGVELIAWDSEGTNNVYSMGHFSKDVWPVAGLYTDDQISGSGALAADKLSAASFKPARILPAEKITEPGGFATVDITMPKDATNGIFTVRYDADVLRCTQIRSAVDAQAHVIDSEEGTVTLAFADKHAVPTGTPVASLVFLPLEGDALTTELTITTTELNAGGYDYTEKVSVTVGTVHRHSYIPSVTAPTCTEGGCTTYTCACGDVYTADETPALGHGFVNGDCSRCDAVMESPFTDVPVGQFYFDPVRWAVERNITTGATATAFDPNGACLRGHVVTFLWRAVGSPAPTTRENPFVDVDAKDYFYDAVLWAYENKITTGVDSSHFDPTGLCNRAQVVTFLWRVMGYPEPETVVNPFVDVRTTDFFYKPILWAVEKAITNGVDATHFGPNSACNRAQVVTFLFRTYN